MNWDEKEIGWLFDDIERELENDRNKIYALQERINRYEKIFFYGAGRDGAIIAGQLCDRYDKIAEKCAFVDSNENKWGTEICRGIKCTGIYDVLGLGEKAALIITTSRFADDIEWELLKSYKIYGTGLENVWIDVDYCYTLIHIEEREYLLGAKADIMRAYGKLTDAKSKRHIYEHVFSIHVRDKVLQYHWGILPHEKEKYPVHFFENPVCEKDAVLGGLFADEYRNIFSGLLSKCRSLDIFEVNRVVMNNEMIERGREDNVRYFNAGLGNKNCTYYYEQYENDPHGKYAFLGFLSDESVHMLSIDEMYEESEKDIGLIVLRMHNGQSDALDGAENIIRTKKPNIVAQVDGFHRLPQGFSWNLINKIAEWVPEYTIAIRNFVNAGTFLLAWLK